MLDAGYSILDNNVKNQLILSIKYQASSICSVWAKTLFALKFKEPKIFFQNYI